LQAVWVESGANDLVKQPIDIAAIAILADTLHLGSNNMRRALRDISPDAPAVAQAAVKSRFNKQSRSSSKDDKQEKSTHQESTPVLPEWILKNFEVTSRAMFVHSCRLEWPSFECKFTEIAVNDHAHEVDDQTEKVRYFYVR